MAARLRYVPFICLAALLLFTYRLYTFSYFSTDDFNNLYWVQQQSALQMLWYILDPVSRFFRPTGMAVYWLLLRAFGLNAFAYHLVAWSIHTANTVLVYAILKRVTESHAGAVTGAMLFASQAVFSDIYGSFGTIFELVCAAAMFGGILLWNEEDRSWSRSILCFLVFVFAFKAKEMAVTLPLIYCGCDLLLRQSLKLKKLWQLLPFAAFGTWYGLIHLADMRGTSPAGPYYLDLRWITLGRGYAGYFNELLQTSFRWQYWAIGFVAFFLLFLVLKMWRAVFFQAYVFISFLPVIFLINHRSPFYWYIPMLGVCGLASLLVKPLSNAIARKMPDRLVPVGAAAAAIVLAVGMYFVQRNATDAYRQWQRGISAEYRSFVASVRALPPPAPAATIFFESYPRYFNAEVLRNAAQVSLRRTDIDAIVILRSQPQ
jgi:hypothetical protein